MFKLNDKKIIAILRNNFCLTGPGQDCTYCMLVRAVVGQLIIIKSHDLCRILNYPVCSKNINLTLFSSALE